MVSTVGINRRRSNSETQSRGNLQKRNYLVNRWTMAIKSILKCLGALLRALNIICMSDYQLINYVV